MAAWLTVYCRKPVSHLTAAELRDGIDNPHADFYTTAEGFGIEDEKVVDRAMARFRVEPVTDPDGIKFLLHYRPARLRQVNLWLSTDPDAVKEEVEEALEQFDGSKPKGARKVRSHLAGVIETVALELGWSQLKDMGVVLAGQAAEYLARVGDGLIRDQNDDWWAMKGGAPVLLVGPAHRG